MDTSSEACDLKTRRRRDGQKRRRVEAAVARLIHQYELPPDTALTLSEGHLRAVIGSSSHKNLSTLKIGIFASKGIAQSVSLRSGRLMHRTPRFRRMSPMRENSRPI